jgi:hypothetical protein
LRKRPVPELERLRDGWRGVAKFGAFLGSFCLYGSCLFPDNVAATYTMRTVAVWVLAITTLVLWRADQAHLQLLERKAPQPVKEADEN